MLMIDEDLLEEFDRQNLETDLLLHRVSREELIYKTFDNEQAEWLREHRSRQSSDVAWNAWCDAMIVERIKEYNEVAIESHNRLVADIEKAFDSMEAQIEELRAEIGSLRAHVTVLEGIQRGTVAELKRTAANAA
jgi:hypothetical protein